MEKMVERKGLFALQYTYMCIFTYNETRQPNFTFPFSILKDHIYLIDCLEFILCDV